MQSCDLGGIYVSFRHQLDLLLVVSRGLYRQRCRLQVIFDEQNDEDLPLILSWLDFFRSLAAQGFPGFEVGEPKFMLDTDVPGVQAADLIAWLVRRDAVNAEKRVDRSTLLEGVLLDRAFLMPSSMKIWTEDDVRRASEQVAAALGV